MIELVKTRIHEQEVIDSLRSDAAGSVLVFIGEPRRSDDDGKVVSIEYSAYEEMAIKELNKIEAEARKKEGIIDIVIIHRVGDVPLKETSLLVIVTSAHRKEGYEVSQWIVEEIKSKVPIWKEVKLEN
ncbi:MAG: molybdenum cofactor biosynthesis protein MoaE [Caldisericaceae bacterium]